MKAEIKKLPIPSMIFTFVTIMIGASFEHTPISYGQAVDLIPIQSGNATLDKGLPEFYDCIDDKIDESKGVGVDPYFEKEPTKHEVSTCYNEVFSANTEVESNDDTEVESNDDTEVESNDDTEVESNDDTEVESNDDTEVESNENSIHRDIERFNSLFGVMG
ncbi:hypothetical protein [Candidatus Nitrosocosmicus franklandus]|nr:hypothetical protein [Candidatus Nitrosocosmicus franklandus]